MTHTPLQDRPTIPALPPLLPCPFCGHSAEHIYRSYVEYVRCANPDCPVHPKAGSTVTAVAVAKWNTRANP